MVVRNDEITVEELAAIGPERLIISPGPQTPKQAGISLAAIKHFYEQIPILGICLGHQAIGDFFGAPLLHNPVPMHGKISRVKHSGHALFEGIPAVFEVMRYHSLCIDVTGNKVLQSIAIAEDDAVLMACAHKTLPIIGIQFHPESIGTPYGQQIISNWAKMNF